MNVRKSDIICKVEKSYTTSSNDALLVQVFQKIPNLSSLCRQMEYLTITN